LPFGAFYFAIFSKPHTEYLNMYNIVILDGLWGSPYSNWILWLYSELSHKTNSLEIFIKDGGHLNTNAGFTKFPELLEKIKTMVL
jgi:hypothetical protein